MYTTSIIIDKIGEISIAKRQNTGNATFEFLLQKDGETLYEETPAGKVPHLYFSLSIARSNAWDLSEKEN